MKMGYQAHHADPRWRLPEPNRAIDLHGGSRPLVYEGTLYLYTIAPRIASISHLTRNGT
jgi:hypothetical protein